MERIIFNWDTTHDTARNVMTNYFVGDITCIVDFKKAIMTVTHRGRTIDIFPLAGKYTVEDHRETECRISAIANQRFNQRRRLKKLCHVLRGV